MWKTSSLLISSVLLAVSYGYVPGPTCAPSCPVNDRCLRPPEFTYPCPNGFVKDRCGCIASCQCEGCPRIDTSLSCPGGRKLDTNGCPKNECEPVCEQCPVNDDCLVPPEFSYSCPNGFVKDRCGCIASCQCEGCPRIDTTLSCPIGRRSDSNGCPIDVCEPCPGCPVNDCGLVPREFSYVCPNGNILDACGCVESCLCAGCPSFNASLPCPNGKKVDANRCPLSECNPPTCEFSRDCAAKFCVDGITVDENGCPLRDCPCKGSSNCPAVVGCNIDCSNLGGYKRVANGCVICECVECSPSDPLCNNEPVCEFAGDCAAVLCEAGVGVAVDENGCPLRGCPCRGSAECPAVVGCTLDCSTQGGYGRDAKGCVVCECAGCLPPGLGPFCNGPVCEFNGDCAAVTCFNEFGNAVDENGCALRGCPCQGAANCPAVTGCSLDCSARGGYKTNRDGCVICECRRPRTKPGSCPRYGVWGTLRCQNDYDCPRTLKCCSPQYDTARKVCHRSTHSVRGAY